MVINFKKCEWLKISTNTEGIGSLADLDLDFDLDLNHDLYNLICISQEYIEFCIGSA